ncbi:MAG: hypothetical protein UW37_C0008G0024 [Candidatus Gottesmanbacteria bacterium GW2011_GWA2_44_17]|uniref:GIY-YIG domain-containing protein n=3 Tax=Candidatus Gottesmaniibacteriota TaxID=1752720 RepID=A0A0G1IPR9_9BACT|nr:MAG: hypothetical protein UV63_C0032G0015 [Microgenomates group bacterium GW2011_GWC1_43_11]KKT36518.1 MAG: hypothetical protein UW22_C0037G0016 [Candidatus Gottesmanbacteria bacterium GW2011_GWB1_44_11c]KKT47424.1 MAG: hypothetical protein UW37_C0008G0024 [Candidatus Gottesmanbacteria bacterium GW2011_GWA2_44_17]KKT61130.1 MAG: hypothetical protein UW52_C0010G0025 [Candidatus Gottesmanbacteria bacterium GW2011_GWA1_44_24b]HCM82097.1 hypothetical protein [Patescibacteria group bacterium]
MVRRADLMSADRTPTLRRSRNAMHGYVYILRSLKNNRFYIGSTINVDKRIQKHNTGFVQSTRNSHPYKIELIQEYRTIKEARQIEYKIKKLKRRDYIEKMILEKYIKLGR